MGLTTISYVLIEEKGRGCSAYLVRGGGAELIKRGRGGLTALHKREEGLRKGRGRHLMHHTD